VLVLVLVLVIVIVIVIVIVAILNVLSVRGGFSAGVVTATLGHLGSPDGVWCAVNTL